MQSVPITTKVVSSNPVYGEVYSIQYYAIKFVIDWRQVGGFSPGILVSFTDHDSPQCRKGLLQNVYLEAVNGRMIDNTMVKDKNVTRKK
jgi:hypothetical protein